jgi:hypothetical protein
VSKRFSEEQFVGILREAAAGVAIKGLLQLRQLADDADGLADAERLHRSVNAIAVTSALTTTGF